MSGLFVAMGAMGFGFFLLWVVWATKKKERRSLGNTMPTVMNEDGEPETDEMLLTAIEDVWKSGGSVIYSRGPDGIIKKER